MLYTCQPLEKRKEAKWRWQRVMKTGQRRWWKIEKKERFGNQGRRLLWASSRSKPVTAAHQPRRRDGRAWRVSNCGSDRRLRRCLGPGTAGKGGFGGARLAVGVYSFRVQDEHTVIHAPSTLFSQFSIQFHQIFLQEIPNASFHSIRSVSVVSSLEISSLQADEEETEHSHCNSLPFLNSKRLLSPASPFPCSSHWRCCLRQLSRPEAKSRITNPGLSSKVI